MDIIIMLIIGFLFVSLFFQMSFIKGKTSVIIWCIALILVLILFKLHVTTPLNYSF